MKTNTLYAGDCLLRMREWPDACVDLIYLDPPFNSKANYNILFGRGRDKNKKDDLAQMTAFTDTWQWDADAEARVHNINKAIDHPAHYAMKAFSQLFRGGAGMLAYLSYMAERLAEMHRVLKPTGSIYLHCDPTASHYLKVVMDEVFGGKNHRNEIVWCYSGGGIPKKDFPRKHESPAPLPRMRYRIRRRIRRIRRTSRLPSDSEVAREPARGSFRITAAAKYRVQVQTHMRHM